MNTDIRLSVGFWQHPKTKKTVRRLGLEGIRSLQILWAWAAVSRPDGNLSGMDWEDVELAADWQGEERKFFDTCLGMWVDESPDGYVLHDWQEHNPWVAEAEIRGGQSRMAKLAQVNREAYDECLRRGIEGLSPEEYHHWKLWRRAHEAPLPSASPAPLLPSRSDRTAPPERPLAKPSAPSPSPNPEEEIQGECVFAGAREEAPVGDASGLSGKAGASSRQPSQGFDEFFEAFPEQHRGSRSEAAGEWVALEASRALPGLPRILDALGQWEDSEAWKRQGGRYIPSAANFLKREYWLRKPPEQEIQSAGPSGGRPMTARQAEAKERGDWAKHILAFDEAVRNGDVEDFGFGTEQGVRALSAADAGAGRIRAAGQGLGRRAG